jgi:hypothetical protein
MLILFSTAGLHSKQIYYYLSLAHHAKQLNVLLAKARHQVLQILLLHKNESINYIINKAKIFHNSATMRLLNRKISGFKNLIFEVIVCKF